MSSSSSALKYGSLFDDDSPAKSPALHSLTAISRPTDRPASLFDSKDDIFSGVHGVSTAGRGSKKYPGLFDDDVPPLPLPPPGNAVAARKLKESVPKKDLFGDEEEEEAGRYTLSTVIGISMADPVSSLPGGETSSLQPIEARNPTPKIAKPTLYSDDEADASNTPAPLPRKEAPTQAASNDLGIDDEGESMFEMKYYEERAKRMRLEARVLELEKLICLMQDQLGIEGDVKPPLIGISEGFPSCTDSSSAADKPHEIGVGLEAVVEENIYLETSNSTTAREKELARRQRQQRRPVSTSARRLGQGSLTKAGAAATEHVHVSSVYESTSSAVEKKKEEAVSSVLSWSSDEEDLTEATSTNVLVEEHVSAIEGQGEEVTDTSTAQDEALARRRQKAYRASMGARPTSRRLGNSRNGSRNGNASKACTDEAPSSAAAGPDRRQSLGGFEKWSDSDDDERKSAKNEAVKNTAAAVSEGRKQSRTDSFEWDSDDDTRGVDSTAATAVVIAVTDEESADRKVVAWARGKDIISMIQTFGNIFEDENGLPDSILNPQINCAADVRKAYLKIVKYCHPDKQSKSGGMKCIAPKLFSALTDAYNAFRSNLT